MADEPAVSYTVKEMLARIDGKLDTGFSGVNTRLDDHAKRISDLEQERHARRSMKESLSGWIASGTAIVIALGSIITLLATRHG